MATVAVHLLVGLLLGLALRLRWWELPIGASLAVFADLDHLEPLVTRVTFHNMFAMVLLPVSVFFFVAGLRPLARLRPLLPLLAAAPCLFASELLLDLVPFELSGGRAAVFWPLTEDVYVLRNDVAKAVDPSAFGSMALLFLLLLLLVMGSRALGWGALSPPHPRKLPAALAGAVLLVGLFPALALSGTLIHAPGHPEAQVEVVADPQPNGTVQLTARHLGGEPFERRSMVFQLEGGGNVLARAANDAPVVVGGSWSVTLRAQGAETASLVGAHDGFVYGRVPLASL